MTQTEKSQNCVQLIQTRTEVSLRWSLLESWHLLSAVEQVVIWTKPTQLHPRPSHRSDLFQCFKFTCSVHRTALDIDTRHINLVGRKWVTLILSSRSSGPILSFFASIFRHIARCEVSEEQEEEQPQLCRQPSDPPTILQYSLLLDHCRFYCFLLRPQKNSCCITPPPGLGRSQPKRSWIPPTCLCFSG